MLVTRGEHRGFLGKATGTDLPAQVVELSRPADSRKVSVPFSDVLVLPCSSRAPCEGARSNNGRRAIVFLAAYGFCPLEALLYEIPTYDPYAPAGDPPGFTYLPRYFKVRFRAWVVHIPP